MVSFDPDQSREMYERTAKELDERWTAAVTASPGGVHTGKTPHVRGKFLVKVGGRPGIALLAMTEAEQEELRRWAGSDPDESA